MKKILLVLSLLLLTSSSAFALTKGELVTKDPGIGNGAYVGDGFYMINNGVQEGTYVGGKDTILDANGFSDLKVIAIAPLLYSPLKNEPTWEETQKLIEAEVAKLQSENLSFKIISYEEMAEKILKATGQDLSTMHRRQKSEAFKKIVPEFADGYAEITIANGSKNCDFFIDVKKSIGNSTVFSYKTNVAGITGRDTSNYTTAIRGILKAMVSGKKEAAKQKSEDGVIEWKY